MSEFERICKKQHRNFPAVLFLCLEEPYNLYKKLSLQLYNLTKM